MDDATPITRFFSGRSVFITGATGFMGKVLIEKLLRSCPELENIYILIRPKKEKTAEERLREMFELPLFEQLHLNFPDARHKVIPVPGDMTCPGLGINQDNLQVIQDNVSIVFHSAATVRFDEPLKNAIIMNTLGTKRLIEICFKMKKLEALIHVSTAYCNCNLKNINEAVYEPDTDVYAIMRYAENLTDDDWSASAQKILDTHPNSYTYTKFLAEKIVLDHSKYLPISIVRPSIVTASWKEPSGWIDNINGPTGLIIGFGKGVLHTVWCYEDCIVDLIPVDVVINLLISVAWYTATTRPDGLMVFNATTGAVNPIRWKDLKDIMYSVSLRFPLENVLWYPTVSFKKNKFFNDACAFLFHTIPAHVVDLVLKLNGKKTHMVHILNKFNRALCTLEYFTTHQWNFSNENISSLYKKLDSKDKMIFNFNTKEIDWENYIRDFYFGIQKYILKEETTPSTSTKKHFRRMFWVHRISQVLTSLFLFNIITKYLPVVQDIWEITSTYVLNIFKRF